MIFEPGEYYVGDLGYVLPVDDLRTIMFEIMTFGSIRDNHHVRELETSKESALSNFDYYWIAKTQHKSGCFYDQTGKAWGFDWGMFGCMPFKWVQANGCYEENKVSFSQPFKCELKINVIVIGHLIFSTTFNK